MLYDLTNYPEWLVGALVIGAVVGWCTYSDAPRRGRIVNWVMWAALFVIGLVIVVLKVVQGRHGLWVEIALLLTAFYILGCFAGGWLKNVLGAHEPAAAVAPVMPSADAWRAAARAAPNRPAADAAAKAKAERPVAATDAAKGKKASDTLKPPRTLRPSILLRKRMRRRKPSHRLRWPGRLRRSASPWRPLRKPRPSVLLRRPPRKPKQSAWLLPPRRTWSA